jgi:hypothetical protein
VREPFTSACAARRVREVKGMSDDSDVELVRFVDDRPLEGRTELLYRAIPIVHPNLDEGDLLRNFVSNRFPCFVFGRDTVG